MKKFFTLVAAAFATASAFAAITSAPESADVQTWYFNAHVFYPSEDIVNKEMQVAKDGNDIYIKGFGSDDAGIDNWVKGTLSGSTYTFDLQDLGNYYGYNMSFGGFDGYTASAATATVADNELTFTTGIALIYTDYGSEAIWWEEGCTLSAEAHEYIEPDVTDQTATLPYKNDFDTEAKRAQVTCHPDDQTGWNWAADWDTNNWYASCNNDSYQQANDYLFFPGVALEAGQKYVVTFDANTNYAAYWQNYEVLIANEPKLSKYTTVIRQNTTCSSKAWEEVETEFSVEEAGTYYVAIHCISYAYNGWFSVDNYSIKAVDMDMPEVAENVTVTPGSKGALNATISFTLPTANIAGQAYDANKELTYTVTRGELVVGTGTDKAGALVFVTDNGEGLTNGVATYKVVVNDGNHVSKDATATGYIGLDYPSDPEYVEITAEGNQVTIAWTPVTRGANGGYVGAKYNVYACSSRNQRGEKLNDEPLTECSYTFEYDVESGDQRDAWFCVTAVNEIDESYGKFESIPAGAPYELPFADGFARNNTHLWTYGGLRADAYIDGYGSFSTDGDNTSLCMYAYTQPLDGAYATATSGKIYTAKNAKMTFDYMTECALTMCVSVVENGDDITICEQALEEGEGSIELEDIFGNVDSNVALVRFSASNFAGLYSGLYIDNLLIEVIDTPTAISQINAESDAKVYNLNGQLVVRPAAGLYIQNGQKLMVK